MMAKTIAFVLNVSFSALARAPLNDCNAHILVFPQFYFVEFVRVDKDALVALTTGLSRVSDIGNV